MLSPSFSVSKRDGRHASAATWPIYSDAAAPSRARIRVAGERDAIVELNDGTRIDLAPASLAQVRGAEGPRRETFELLDGRGRFDVKPRPRPFEVDTPIGKVAVLGTIFTIDVETPERIRQLRLRKRPDWTMTVAVTHGKVRVQHAADSVELTDDQSRTIVKENAPDLTGAIERIADKEDPRFYVRVRAQKVSPVDKIRRVLIRNPVLVGMDALQVGQVVEVWFDRDATDIAYCIALAGPDDQK